MAIPFFQRLQGLASPSVNKIVAAGTDKAASERIIQQVLMGLPELLGAAVVQLTSGQALALYTSSREFNLSKVLSHNTEVVRQQRGVAPAERSPRRH